MLYYLTIFVRHPWADRKVTKRRFTVYSITFLSRAIFLRYSVTYIALQIDASKKSDIFSSNGFSSVPYTVRPCVISFRSCTQLIKSDWMQSDRWGLSALEISFTLPSSFHSFIIPRFEPTTLKSFSWDNNGRSDLSTHLFL